MTIFKRDTIVKSFPAWDIVTRAVATSGPANGSINISAGDLVTIDGLTHYTANSAVSYALANNEDPIAAHRREQHRFGTTHWLSQNASVLTSHKQEKKTLVQVAIGQVIFFEGWAFEIESAPNNNLDLRKL